MTDEYKAFILLGTFVTAIGFVACLGVALVAPKVDEALGEFDREHPGLIRAEGDAGPSCVAWDETSLAGAKTRVKACAEEP